jgi:hypothetical protein
MPAAAGPDNPLRRTTPRLGGGPLWRGGRRLGTGRRLGGSAAPAALAQGASASTRAIGRFPQRLLVAKSSSRSM